MRSSGPPVLLPKPNVLLVALIKRVKNAVSRYIASHGTEGFTVRDISTSTKQSKVTVNNHVNLLVQRGELVRSERKQSGGRGRPQTIFKLATEQSQEVVAE